jgi:hypothetical protein
MTIKEKIGVRGTRFAVYAPNYVGTFSSYDEAVKEEKSYLDKVYKGRTRLLEKTKHRGIIQQLVVTLGLKKLGFLFKSYDEKLYICVIPGMFSFIDDEDETIKYYDKVEAEFNTIMCRDYVPCLDLTNDKRNIVNVEFVKDVFDGGVFEHVCSKRTECQNDIDIIGFKINEFRNDKFRHKLFGIVLPVKSIME